MEKSNTTNGVELDQVKKYLTLLKQASNEALIGLIAEGLANELKNQPLRVTQTIVDFLIKDLMRGETTDFTRIKVSELIIPVLTQDVSRLLFEAKLNTPHSQEKQVERLERSSMVLKLDGTQPKLLQFQQMKTLPFFQELINNFEPLLSSDAAMPQETAQDSKLAKETTKAGIKQVIMGDLKDNKSLKLSDFIDEKFLEDLDCDGEMPKPSLLKTPLLNMVTALERGSEPIFENLTQKRQKQDEDSYPTHVIMSPMLALIVTQTENLLSLDWKRRQIAACQLRNIFQSNINEFDYSVVSLTQSGTFTLKQNLKISKNQVSGNVLTRTIICLLKDNFSDFEGLKVMVPVREECCKLLGRIGADFDCLIQTLPTIFLAVENDIWHSKLNFFLILKGLAINGDKKIKETLLMMFGNLLIQALPMMEDEPKVAITEILQILLPTYYASFTNPKTPTKLTTTLLDNLTVNLKKSDEIEASAIAVFNLVCKIYDLRGQHKCLSQFKYRLDLNTFGPFNFHKLEPVRLSYNELILKAIESGSVVTKEDLCLLHTLTVQSLVVESNPALVEILLKVLQAILKVIVQEDYQAYLAETLLQDDCLPSWMIAVEPDFKTFKFLESQNFDPIQGDYFRIVFRPVNEQEWEKFYYQKMQNLSRAVSLMLACGKATDPIFDGICKKTGVCEQAEGGEAVHRTLLNQALFIMMLCLEQYQRLQKTGQEIDQQYIQDLASQFLHAQEIDVSIADCWMLKPTMETLNALINSCPEQLRPTCLHIYQLLEDCEQTQTFRNYHELAQQIEQLNQWIATYQNQGFSFGFIAFYTNWQGLLYYTQEYCLRLKQASGSILLCKAREHLGNTDSMQQAGYMHNMLNALMKPLLLQLNQERVEFIRQHSCQSLVDLMIVLEQLKMYTPMKKAFDVILQICVTQKPNQGVKQFITLLVANTENVYNNFKGYLGYHTLNPTFSSSQSVEDWIQLASIMMQGHRGQNKPYKTKANQQIIKLVARALDTKFLDFQLLPEFTNDIFQDLNEDQKQYLMETLVVKMLEKKQVAFDCLNKFLDSQIKTPKEGFLIYIPLFILPIIKSLQLQNQIYLAGEKLVMKILAKLLQLLPLNIGSLQATTGNKQLQDKLDEGLAFLKVFAENKIIDEYPLVIKVNAKLRDYQKEGINWMAKLGAYNLNCALCDDMGLGKTLQSLIVVLNESAKQKRKCVNLVVCPTSLTYNWLQEINKFFKGVKAVVIDQTSRGSVLENILDYDLLIVNYEKLKGCMSFFEKHRFFYVVLDEAHKIKNSKSVVAQTVNKLQCDRKIALSGTPLQNRVSELWSLFEFLMPDFLEEESTFNRTYNKYLTGNIKKMQDKLEDTQQFIDALKSLKRRIAPFILRRTKEDVLKELPPKVIQDYECIMPTSQANAHTIVERTFPFANVLGSRAGQNTLQNLILHRKVCNHPFLVNSLVPGLPPQNSQSFEQSGKLIGLIEILQLAEIIQEPSDEQQFFESKQPHRALLFCQMQSFMQLVETEVLKKFGIKYLSLKGSMSSKERIEVVDMFNNDPAFQVLILTTAVGGLGLTLTGANLVIFLEHDWNPMKDLQAMDRAHRIGQTRTVNVYRLILKDTVEEKIMSLQRFKENLARSLIQNKSDLVDNSGLDLTDLLKSFEEHSAYQKQTSAAPKAKQDGKLTMTQVINQSVIDAEAAMIADAFKDTDFEKL